MAIETVYRGHTNTTQYDWAREHIDLMMRQLTGRDPLSDARGTPRTLDAAALGERPVGRLLWHACTQTTIAVGVYGIYALTNAWFVARGVGTTAMAAVNLVAPLLLALGAVSTALGVGAASVVSRHLGAGDTATAARAAGNAFVVFWAAAVTITVIGLTGLEPLLRLLGAHGETLGYARDYAVVILAGAIVSTGFSSLVRAEGRMRFATMLWVVPVAVQITLDPLLIFGLDLGVRGAALGTVGGQAVSAAMSMWFFFVQRHRPYRIRRADLRPHLPTVRTQCTTSPDSARTVGFPPRELRDLQLRVRTEQQTPEWKTRYAVRSGVEGTVNEFAHGYGMRRCRYRGQGKAHIQHVLTAIAVNIERLSGLPPTEEAPTPRRPTAFQNYLDQREIPRPKSWRTLGS